jgi:hypothetical protein
MSIIQSFYVASLLVLALPRSALAADSTPAEAERVSAVPPGVATHIDPGGFALVTFGTWMVPESPNHGAVAPAPHDQPTAASAKNGSKVSSYRRAIYLQQVRDAEQRYALPVGLLDALIWTESRYNPMALSKAGAAGLGQLMPATASAMGVANRYYPRANILGAARHLRLMLDQFGAINLAVAAYNAGPGAVRAAEGVPSNHETPDYVRNVLNVWRKIAE